MKLTRERTFILVVVLVVFAVGFLGGRLTSPDSKWNPNAPKKYPFLARRVQSGSSIINNYHINFAPMRQDLQTYIDGMGDYGENVSVYFEYLPSGVSLYINENNKSIAASLMKVPVVMALYKKAEMGQVDLDKKVALKQEWLNDEYGTLYQKGAGYELTVREAAKLTLRDSDNTALYLVYDQVNDDGGGLDYNDGNSVVSYLDMNFDVTDDQRVLIGAQSYSSIFKCLYLSCYNSLEYSQEMLSYLSESSFTDRLMRFLPSGTQAAHKIGTFSDSFQSDCGIFYIPAQNYLLCVMVKGSDPDASYVIADISNKVYNYIEEQVKPTTSWLD